jgi:hypothetical protein
MYPNFSLNQCVFVTDELANKLPILSFDLVVIVEPDQSALVNNPCIYPHDSLDELSRIYCESLADEALEKGAFAFEDGKILSPDNTRFLWLRNFADTYFKTFAGDAAQISFHYGGDIRIPEDMHWYVQSAYQHHPDWQVAIIGGLLEADIVPVANLFQEAGFQTTVLTRYCLTLVNATNPSGG